MSCSRCEINLSKYLEEVDLLASVFMCPNCGTMFIFNENGWLEVSRKELLEEMSKISKILKEGREDYVKMTAKLPFKIQSKIEVAAFTDDAMYENGIFYLLGVPLFQVNMENIAI